MSSVVKVEQIGGLITLRERAAVMERGSLSLRKAAYIPTGLSYGQRLPTDPSHTHTHTFYNQPWSFPSISLYTL